MSTTYIYTFGAIMTIVVAALLAGLKGVTEPLAAKGEEVFNKRAILAAVAGPIEEATQQKVADLAPEQVLEIFDKQVKQTVVDAAGSVVDGVEAFEVEMDKEKKKPAAERIYPIYEFNLNGERYYIFSVIGNGLWDIIWGNIALKSDLNTVAGASFDHAGETPGLGAEIKDNKDWVGQFPNKEIFKDGEFVGINVRKGGAIDKTHEVDGLSGATVTADGVTDMIYNGLQAYETFFNEKRAEAGSSR